MKVFLSGELPGGLPTEWRRFSSPDALPCARRDDQPRAGEARGGGHLGRSFDGRRRGLQLEHVKCVHTVQNTLSVRAPVCAGCWECARIDSKA